MMSTSLFAAAVPACYTPPRPIIVNPTPYTPCLPPPAPLSSPHPLTRPHPPSTVLSPPQTVALCLELSAFLLEM